MDTPRNLRTIGTDRFRLGGGHHHGESFGFLGKRFKAQMGGIWQ
jgi:hypothetical protein